MTNLLNHLVLQDWKIGGYIKCCAQHRGEKVKGRPFKSKFKGGVHTPL